MKKQDFIKKYKTEEISESEIERKWLLHTREIEMNMMLENIASSSSGAASGAAGAGLAGRIIDYDYLLTHNMQVSLGYAIGDDLNVYITFSGTSAFTVTIYWGDGTSNMVTSVLGEETILHHTYVTPGEYTIISEIPNKTPIDAISVTGAFNDTLNSFNFKTFTNLTKLTVQSPVLTYFSPQAPLTGLQELTIANTTISNFNFVGPSTLTTVILSNNPIRVYENPKPKDTDIKNLNLSGNPLTEASLINILSSIDKSRETNNGSIDLTGVPFFNNFVEGGKVVGMILNYIIPGRNTGLNIPINEHAFSAYQNLIENSDSLKLALEKTPDVTGQFKMDVELYLDDERTRAEKYGYGGNAEPIGNGTEPFAFSLTHLLGTSDTSTFIDVYTISQNIKSLIIEASDSVTFNNFKNFALFANLISITFIYDTATPENLIELTPEQLKELELDNKLLEGFDAAQADPFMEQNENFTKLTIKNSEVVSAMLDVAPPTWTRELYLENNPGFANLNTSKLSPNIRIYNFVNNSFQNVLGYGGILETILNNTIATYAKGGPGISINIDQIEIFAPGPDDLANILALEQLGYLVELN